MVVGTTELESVTSCMSSKRSNQLSYAPVATFKISYLRAFVKPNTAVYAFLCQVFIYRLSFLRNRKFNRDFSAAAKCMRSRAWLTALTCAAFATYSVNSFVVLLAARFRRNRKSAVRTNAYARAAVKKPGRPGFFASAFTHSLFSMLPLSLWKGS